MKTPAGKWRTTVCLLSVLLISAGLAACGGGGGGGTSSSTSPGVSGPAVLSVAVGSAPDYPAGTTFAPSALSPDTLAPANSPDFDNVFVWVTKLALIPSSGPESPDRNGELEQDSSAENGQSAMNGFVTITLPHPVRIDLLHPPTGRQVATLLNKVSEVPVPAGEYSKIRVYYDNVVGHKDGVAPDTVFHPTAHYHFDVHFVRGNLVIPVDAPQAGNIPQEGIRFYSVVINIVGLKYHQAGNSGNVLLRPQVFAEFVPPIFYSVKGTARNVAFASPSDPVTGTFNVEIGGMESVPVTFDNNTVWAYSDNVLFGSGWKILDVPNQRVADAFRDRAKVKVIGWFDGGTFHGTDIILTFPDVREGKSDNVWIPPDNVSFIVRSTDNVTVFPKPARGSAYYDNLATPGPWDADSPPLRDTNLDNNLRVRVRGYFEDPVATNLVLESYWISIGGPYVGP